MTKQCTNCKENKEDAEFYLIKRPAPRNPSLYRHCKECCRIITKQNKNYSKNWELLKKYNITLEEYKIQCSLRDNCCDICSNKVITLHVDHSHLTGKVRGYLCGSCNRGIGLLKDSASICLSAGKYLNEKG
ncbi:Recombination endonuclease VII [uncultured Caudovirales phage]|uniref:Recombination endonuclease VII n=1 Tax=uncultured Caudovirales phage TaxID=2100421 RepID=A0A6J7X058_9CAUD|nr:Recombination endonuclease VII [uncultured Caudovirales phage]